MVVINIGNAGKEKKMFCTNCGNQLPDNAKFCFKCGQSVGQKNGGDSTEKFTLQKPKKKRKWGIALLILFIVLAIAVGGLYAKKEVFYR